jgi:CheY-like chemotaxis protein
MAQGDILIVDDGPEVVVLLEELLQEEGYTTRSATDGPTALAALQAARPDLVLLDFHLPGMTGLQLLKAANALGLEMGPVVLITASSPPMLPQRLTGIVECVFKPFDIEALLACVALWLRAGAAGDSPPLDL